MESYSPNPFYDRANELAALERAWNSGPAGGRMMLLYGRRRLGKTYLLQRYFTCGMGEASGEKRPHCYFLAQQTTSTAQRMSFALELLEAFPNSGATAEELAVSWNALFRFVSIQARAFSDGRTRRFGLILDEFPYLVEQSPELPSILQAWWDRDGIHSPVFVVLCGSQLSAMTALGKESAPLYGRFNAGIIQLEPLSYHDVASFYRGCAGYGVREILTLYGVFGGTPRYHALVDATRSFDEEIISLLLQPRAPLENEVRFLLGSEQIRDPAPYNAVLGAIARGSTQFGRIMDETGIERGKLSFYLKGLQELGWVWREFPLGETSERRALYRAADPFLMFWRRFVDPVSSALQFSDPRSVYEMRIAPYLPDYMGHVFEDICAQWLKWRAHKQLGLSIRKAGRYWSRNGDIEIDLVAQLEDDSYLFGECKWRANNGEIKMSDYIRLRAKVEALPNAAWKLRPSFALFTAGEIAPDLQAVALNSKERLFLISGADLL